MTPIAPPENDFALLDRFANHGDEEAFAEIVRRYAGVVYATSYRVVQDRGRAEDVAQEVFFKLLRRPQSVSQSLGGWLHQCATRLALDDVRSETARRKREANRRIELPDEDTQAQTWAELSPHVDEALATLPEELRELLVSHFLQGKSQNAIAVETRTSPATISRRMRDAVTALRAELRRSGVVVAPALLVGLFKMNAPSQAALVPQSLLTELGKMAIVGKPAAALSSPFAWHSVSAWCDVAAKSCGYPAEIVKQMVAVAATGAVALVAGILVAQAYAWLVHMNDPTPSPVTATATRVEPQVQLRPAVKPTQPAAPKPAVAPDVRVTPASESDAAKVVLFHWPEKQDGAMGVTYGDGRRISLPASLARKLIEDQAGKTLEQLSEESAKGSPAR
jgi:RNA polymerase sigma factor (sigma-70 family)